MPRPMETLPMGENPNKSPSSGRRRRRSRSESGRDADRDAEKYRKLKHQITVGALLAVLAFGLTLIFVGLSE